MRVHGYPLTLAYDRPRPPSLCASVDRLNIVAVWIEHECGIVARCVLLAQSRPPVVDPAGLQGTGVEGVDLSLGFSSEGCVLFDGMLMKAVDPEYRMIPAVTDTVGTQVFGN